jgi:hypothetical protein
MLIYYIALMSTIVPVLLGGYVISVILDLTKPKIFFIDALVWGTFPFCLPIIFVYYIIHEQLEKRHQQDIKKIIHLEEKLQHVNPDRFRR